MPSPGPQADRGSRRRRFATWVSGFWTWVSGFLHPGGMAACSRWLSAATPPVLDSSWIGTPEGFQQGPEPRVIPFPPSSSLAATFIRKPGASLTSHPAGTPPGFPFMGAPIRGCRSAQPPATSCIPSGDRVLAIGLARLNKPRLQAASLPGIVTAGDLHSDIRHTRTLELLARKP